MELEEVETINLRDTALPFACTWSEDDSLSVISENEVHILKLKPNMRTVENTINFLRQTIKPRDEYPNKELIPFLNDVLCKEQRLNVYNMLNDAILTPDGKSIDCQDIIPRCSQCCWSPSGVHKSKCALVFLSNTGNVDIQVNQGQFWVVIADLTKLYIQQTDLFKHFDSFTLNYETLKTHTYKASTICVDWSPLYENEYSYIVTGQMNSDVIVWKFYNLSLSQLEHIPELIIEFSTNLSRLTAIHWVKTSNDSSMIIVGDINGDVKGFEINDFHNTVNVTNIYDYWMFNDSIRVDKLFSEQIESNFLITCIKRSNIVLFLISNTGLLLDHKIKKVGNLAITGYQHIKTGVYAICTLTAYIGLLSVNVNNNEIQKIDLVEIKHSVNANYMSTYGICCSKQKVMWFICSNYCKSINHLIIREQIQLSICSNNFYNIENILIGNSNNKLTNYWDCLELCRLLHDKKEPFCKLYELIENYDNVSLYRLKIYLWIAIFNDNVLKKKKRIGKPIANEILTPPEELLKLVKTKCCLEQLKSIVDLEELTELQLYSVRYLREYLIEIKKSPIFKTCLGKNTEDEIEQILNHSEKIQQANLLPCSLCDADISYNGKCLNGHQENQCVITFVPFSALWYPICPHCDCPAHPDLKEEPLICSLCDNIMVHCDYKLLQDDLNKYELE